MYKNIKFFTFILMIGFATSFLISCNNDDNNGGGDEISEEERAVLEDLVGTWTVTNVTQDGEDPQLGDYSNLSITFDADLSDGSDKVYSVSGGDYALPDTDNESWSFVDGSLNTDNPVIERADGTLMRINELDGTTLVLQLDVTEELNDDRVATIGTYVFTFTR